MMFGARKIIRAWPLFFKVVNNCFGKVTTKQGTDHIYFGEWVL